MVQSQSNNELKISLTNISILKLIQNFNCHSVRTGKSIHFKHFCFFVVLEFELRACALPLEPCLQPLKEQFLNFLCLPSATQISSALKLLLTSHSRFCAKVLSGAWVPSALVVFLFSFCLFSLAFANAVSWFWRGTLLGKAQPGYQRQYSPYARVVGRLETLLY
jgi:hypothetical protein